MTDAQLAEIEARLRAATPGPWTKDPRGGGVVRGSTLIEFVRGSSYTQVALAVGLHEKEAGGQEENATFIANAPADIAALLAEVSRLKVELQASHDNFTRMVELNKEEQKLRDSAQEISAMMKDLGYA